jgi:cytochrome c biogenesis protein CcmG/thiol:disulfide interchange protein DsbE
VKVKHPARVTALAVFALFIALAVLLASQVRNDPSFKGGNLLNKAVPPFDLPSLSGGPHIRSADLTGKVVLVNFWNSWCIPCQQEHAALSAFYARHRADDDVEMIGIVRDDTAGAARQWVKDHKDGWTFATDPDGQAALGFGTTGQPESFMISPSGVVAGFLRSPVSEANLEEMLAAARQLA